MKDLSLSLLSRGCGRFVSSKRNTGRHDGRLDVCFTPQDYYIWKSQDSLLRLSTSGRLFAEAESTLPKTYTTRRGPLLLYSQDLVTMETCCHSETRDRRQRVVRRYTQQEEQQLSTLKELTAAILSYSNNQVASSRPGPTCFPPLHLPLAADFHCPSLPPIRTTQEQPSPEFLVQLKPQRRPAERNTEQLENQPEDKEDEQGGRKRVRLDLFLQIPRTSRTPTPQMELQPWVHYVTTTPEEPQEPQTSLDISPQQPKINHQSMGGELHYPDRNCVHDEAEDQGSAVIGDRNYERSISGMRHGRKVRVCGTEQQPNSKPDTNTTTATVHCRGTSSSISMQYMLISMMPSPHTGLLPPLTVGHSVCQGPSWEKKDRPRREGPSGDEHRLPSLAESYTVAPGRAIQGQTKQDAQPKAERAGLQTQENVNRLQQHLFLPLLFSEKEEEISEKQRGGGEKTERQYFRKETVGQGGGGGRGSETSSVILLEPGEELPPPVGVLGCVAGRKGPGKQSSLAFLQNRLPELQDPWESVDANRGVVRGVLPLELRDLQNGSSVGSLILGPDGEIIQLSLYDNTQDPPRDDSDTQEQALQVLSAEGEKLPWVIVLQPEHAHTRAESKGRCEGGVELNTDVPEGNIQPHQSMHKLLDLHRSTEANACSLSSHTNQAAVMKTKSTEPMTETLKGPRKGAKYNVRLPPLRERRGREEPRGGKTEAEEEEDEEEELGSTGQTNHSSGSDGPGLMQQNISPNEASAEDNMDKRKKNTKRKEAEEAAVTTRKRDMKTVKSTESPGQKTSRAMKEGGWQKTGRDAQPIRSQKQEKTNREAAETQDRAAVPSVKKKLAAGKEQRSEVKVDEETEAGEAARQEEESAGRRRRRKRRGRLTHREFGGVNHDFPLEKEELEINQEIKEESATPRPNNNTRTSSEEDEYEDHLSTSAETHSSVQSVSSLRSAAASQFSQRGSRRSAASSCEGAVTASATGLASSRGRLSSCSTVMVPEEQLMLNPVKPELSRPRKSQEEEEEEAAALRLAQRAERRRQDVERKRKEREQEERKQQEKEQTEERMKSELEEERRKRAEQLRLKRLAEEEERRKREEEELERARREQAQREKERRRQEERKKQMERLQRMREEEEQRKKAELEHLRLEEERRQEEESKMLQEMDESERTEYLRRKEQEEEENRRNKEEERKRREEEDRRTAEEAKLQAELLARQMALLQQQLAFKRGLALEAGGLEKTQGISRPWIYSYFALLQLLNLNPSKAETTAP